MAGEIGGKTSQMPAAKHMVRHRVYHPPLTNLQLLKGGACYDLLCEGGDLINELSSEGLQVWKSQHWFALECWVCVPGRQEAQWVEH